MTNEDLQLMFRQYNKRFFGGRLDKNMLVEFRRIPIEDGVRLEGYQLGDEIIISSELKRHWDSACITLLHEMAHADLPEYIGNKDMDAEHGPLHQARIVELFKAGAYDGLL